MTSTSDRIVEVHLNYRQFQLISWMVAMARASLSGNIGLSISALAEITHHLREKDGMVALKGILDQLNRLGDSAWPEIPTIADDGTKDCNGHHCDCSAPTCCWCGQVKSPT